MPRPVAKSGKVAGIGVAPVEVNRSLTSRLNVTPDPVEIPRVAKNCPVYAIVAQGFVLP